MSRKLELFTLISLFALSMASFADQVTLKNGDRLTGTIVKSDGKTLVIHTDAAGDITVALPSVQEIKTDAELHVSLKGGRRRLAQLLPPTASLRSPPNPGALWKQPPTT